MVDEIQVIFEVEYRADSPNTNCTEQRTQVKIGMGITTNPVNWVQPFVPEVHTDML